MVLYPVLTMSGNYFNGFVLYSEKREVYDQERYKVIQIGDRVIGGGNPVLIQSMSQYQN